MKRTKIIFSNLRQWHESTEQNSHKGTGAQSYQREKSAKSEVFSGYLLRRLPTLVLLVGLALVACSREQPATPTAVSTATISVTMAPTRTLSPTRTLAPEPTATPVIPLIAAASQILTDNGRIVIATVTAMEPAWVVIHAVRNGNVEEVLGYTAVPPGTVQDVAVTIDPLQATETMVAVLHQDAGAVGEFEFPGSDEPIRQNTAVVSSEFSVEMQVSLPGITASDQEVLEDGLVSVDNVFALADGWLMIHADQAGQIGELLGFSAVSAGQNDNLTVPIPWREATPTLHAVLYQDNGRSRQLDYPGDDLPVLISGQLVLTSFHVTLPPDVMIFDQPVVNNSVVIERVISNGPGWATILADNNGQPGFIIGFAQLADGLNVQVVVEVLGGSVTNPMYVQIHEDLEIAGEFDFPRSDPAITYQGRLVVPFSFRTNPGNYLLTQDQPLVESSFIVPTAVVESAGWLVIYTDVDGELGEIIGQAHLVAGVNRNIVVEVKSAQVTPVLHAVLHLDAEVIEEFEFPNGPDVPFRRNSIIIQSPFAVFTNE